MSNSKDRPNSPFAGLQSEEVFPGVRVTRRIALQNSAAAVLLMALGVSGCGSEAQLDEDEGDDEDSGPESKKSKSPSKKKKKGKSKGKSDKDTEGDEDTGDDDDTDDSGEEDSGEDSQEPEDSEDSGEDSEEPKDDDSSGDEGSDDEDEDDDSPLTLDEIVAKIVDDANKLVKDQSMSEAEYQKRVGKLLARLDKNEKIPRISPGRVHNMRRINGDGPIHIFVMEMAPNANIPLHDHSNRIGNILGWRGTIRTKNYTRIEDKDGGRSDGSFLLQETDAREITKGQTGYLARVENNFHIVTAGPQGATLLDMFTYYDDSKAGVPGGGSRFVSLGQVVDREKKIYRANYSRALAHVSPHDFS